MELISNVLEQGEGNDQTREVVRPAAAEGPEVGFCCLSFRKSFTKDSPLLVPAAESRLEVELHNLSPSHQVGSFNLPILCFNHPSFLLICDL